MTTECTSLWASLWDGGSSSVAQVVGQLETGCCRPAAVGSIWVTGTHSNKVLWPALKSCQLQPFTPEADMATTPNMVAEQRHCTDLSQTLPYKEADEWKSCRGNTRRQPTCEMSITESQLRGRAEVKSLKPSRVDMIPFWSMRRIMVPSTKKITPYLSTVMPEDKREKESGSLLGGQSLQNNNNNNYKIK